MMNQEVIHQERVDEDFARQAVPINARKSFLSITIVWLGFVFVITSMMTGGGLAAGLTFSNIVIAVILGNIFLSIIAIAVSYMAAKTGLCFALITRYSFGNKGSKIATLFVPIVNIGWYTIQAAMYGHFIAQVLGIKGFGELIILFVSTVAMGIFAFSGMKAITILGYIAIPAIIFLSLGTAMKSVMLEGSSVITSWTPSQTINMVSGITIVIGTWILSTATCIADIMRYAKSAKEAMLSAIIGLVGGNSLLLICGAIAGIAMKESDLTVVLLGLGLIIPSLILMTTNIFTTNAANLYSTSLNLENTFSLGRKKIILVILICAGFLSWTRPYNIDFLFTFLNLLGIIVPPLAGIIIADYYIIHKRKYPALDSSQVSDWNISPWITWAISFAIVKLLMNINQGGSALNGIFGLPALNGIIISVILYPIIHGITNKFRRI